MKNLHVVFLLLVSTLTSFVAGQNETQITISSPSAPASSNAGNRTITIILSQTQAGESKSSATPQVTVTNSVVSASSSPDNTSTTTSTTTSATTTAATTTVAATTVATTNATATNATAINVTTTVAAVTPTTVLPSSESPSTTTAPAAVASKVVVSISGRALPPPVAAQNEGPQAQGVATGVVFPAIVDSPQPPAQSPNVWVALNSLKTKGRGLISNEISEILASAVAGRDYPNYNSIPETSFRCDQVKQAGFYADPEAACQVFRRCDINGYLWSFLCPNQTLFNQVTLVCDWFFNVDCSRSVSFYDYSNSRLYHSNWRLLDDK